MMRPSAQSGGDPVATTKTSDLPSYLSTYRHFKTGQLVRDHVIFHVLLPLGAGLACFLTSIQLTFIAQLLGGVSILAGFLFTLIVFIFQLRTDVARSEEVARYKSLHRLIDELFATVNHAIFVALILVAWLMWLSATMAADSDALPRLVSAALVGLSAHLLGVLWSISRRTATAYRELLTVPTAGCTTTTTIAPTRHAGTSRRSHD